MMCKLCRSARLIARLETLVASKAYYAGGERGEQRRVEEERAGRRRRTAAGSTSTGKITFA